MTNSTEPAQPHLDSPEQFYTKVLDTFSRMGYPPSLVQHWALPPRDASILARTTAQLAPKNVLEVGTFVGVATMLMAANMPDDGKIHTIDPNFALDVELQAMKTEVGEADTMVRPHDLACRAAETLQLGDKIVFHEGGFSVSDSYATYRGDQSHPVTKVGRRVCEEFGPFDLVFIDGLHFADAVLADLELAAEYLRPGGAILMHDVNGVWGSSVRSAVFRFLESHRDFLYSQPPYRDFFSAIGRLQHVSADGSQPAIDVRPVVATDEPPVDPQHFDPNSRDFTDTLAALIVHLLAPRSVVHLMPKNSTMLDSLRQIGVSDVRRHDSVASLGAADVTRCDVILCFDVLDALAEDQSASLLDACCGLSDCLVLGITPPGEPLCDASPTTPLALWARMLLDRGYVLRDVLRPAIEPLCYAATSQPLFIRDTTQQIHLLVATKQWEPGQATQAAKEWLDLLLEKERRIEDLVLQNLDLGIRWRTQLAEARMFREEYEAGREKYLALAEENAKARRLIRALERIPLLGRFLQSRR